MRTIKIISTLVFCVLSQYLKAQFLTSSVNVDTFGSEISNTNLFFGNAIKTKKISDDNIIMLHHLHNINPNNIYNETNNFGRFDSVEVVKYALNGNKIWKKKYYLETGGLISDFVETPDKCFLLVGNIELNNSIIKLDSLGNLIFVKNYPITDNHTTVEKIVATNDGNYIIVSNTDSILGIGSCSTGNYSIHTSTFITKINSNGNIIWQKQLTDNYLINSTSGYNSILHPTVIDVLNDSSNTINIIKNYVPSFNSEQIIKLFHIDANGTILDEHLIGDYNDISTCLGNRVRSTIYITENGYTCTQLFPYYTVLNTRYSKSGIYINADTLELIDGSGDYRNTSPNSIFNEINTIFYFKENYYLTEKSANNTYLLSKSKENFDDKWTASYEVNPANTPELFYLTNLNDTTLLLVISSLRGDPNTYQFLYLEFKTIALNSNQINYTCFIDKNQNQIFDSTDLTEIDASIELTKNASTEIFIPYSGKYMKFVTAGNYISKLISYNQTLKYYDVSPISKTTNFATNKYGIDSVFFRLTPKPNIKDLQVSIVPITNARPGFNSYYKIIAKNVGTEIMYLPTVKFIKDALQTFNDTIYTTDNDSLFWQMDSLSLLEQREITVSLLNAVPPTLNTNDTLHLSAIIYPIENDSFVQDNYASLNQIVINSIDPNDKIETHGGNIPYSAIQNRDYLYYTIRFQNTGNSYASRIIIMDTLTNNLDASTLEILSSSIPFAMNVVDRKYITWTAASTYLPDSTSDEINSHGYISFRIKPKVGLTPSDEITNRASIVFDYNAAISTNTCTTKIIEQRILSVKQNEIKSIKLFPNPTNGNVQLTMSLLQNKNYNLRIIDINGNILSIENIKGNIGENNMELNLSNYANGIYFIQIADENQNLFYGKIVKQ